MKRLIALTLALFVLGTSTSLARDAMDYYRRGLESSIASKRVENFTRAIELDPALADAYEKRAVHFYFQGKLERAIRDYTRVIELRPERSEALLMRGLCRLKVAHGDGFFAELDRIAPSLGIRDKKEAAVFLDTAISDLGRAIELDPSEARAYAFRAEAFRLKGLFNKAVSDANRAIELNQGPASTGYAYYTRSAIWRKLGLDELWKADYMKYLELNPISSDYPPLHVPLFIGYASSSPGLGAVGRYGLIAVVVIIVVVALRLGLPPPRKENQS